MILVFSWLGVLRLHFFTKYLSINDLPDYVRKVFILVILHCTIILFWTIILGCQYWRNAREAVRS